MFTLLRRMCSRVLLVLTAAMIVALITSANGAAGSSLKLVVVMVSLPWRQWTHCRSDVARLVRRLDHIRQWGGGFVAKARARLSAVGESICDDSYRYRHIDTNQLRSANLSVCPQRSAGGQITRARAECWGRKG